MNIWLDAQLSPAMAVWINTEFSMPAIAVRDLGLREAKDREIFFAARKACAVVMTKDVDFIRLIEELGPPPQIIWLTCGNTSNARLKEILTKNLAKAIDLLQTGESVVEIHAT
jgi:predicted nuclease of predicted toxin-antitoxin system